MIRRAAGFLLVLFAVVSGVAVPAEARPKKIDWILLEFDYPQRSGPWPLALTARGRVVADTGLVVGTAASWNEGAEAVASVRRVGTGGLSVHATSPAGRLSQHVSASRDRFSGEFPYWPTDGARAVLFFFAGGTVDRFRISGSGADRARITTGAGSHVLSIVGPGTNAAAGPVGAGRTSHNAAPRGGIVGAFDTRCQDCTGRFTGPAGRNGEFFSGEFVLPSIFVACVCEVPVGDWQFSGPAGRWSWEWTGVTTSDAYLAPFEGDAATPARPSFAAWAQIGEKWRLFRAFPTWVDSL